MLHITLFAGWLRVQPRAVQSACCSTHSPAGRPGCREQGACWLWRATSSRYAW